MPRARAKSGTGKTSAKTSSAAARKAASTTRSSGGTFTCPECGKVFSRAASLGAHRSRAHGVAGSSTNASPAKPASRGLRASRSNVDRDGLLRALFPNGIPARESLIRELNNWLDQGERLARRG